MHFHGFLLQAAQLAEVYWMSLVRDVPFSQYGSHGDTNAAAGKTTPRTTCIHGIAGFAACDTFQTIFEDGHCVLVTNQGTFRKGIRHVQERDCLVSFCMCVGGYSSTST